MPSEDLHEPLRSINKSIARLREDVTTLTGEVKKIPEAITQAATTIRDAIHENIRAQAELKLMDHVMEVRSVKPQIEAERDQIETEREELDERLESIGERYQGKHDDLDETATERIRELGDHIFAIDEQKFEAGIEAPFTEQVTAAWQSLQAHNAEVGEERVSALRETTGEVVQTIHDYVDRQEQLVESIQDHRLDPDALSITPDEPTSIQVPYYVVEYEVDGVTERQPVVPSRLTTDGTEWCAVSLSPVDGAESLLADASPDATAETARLDAATVTDALTEYGESSPLGLSYTDSIEAALPEDGSVPVETTGGDA